MKNFFLLVFLLLSLLKCQNNDSQYQVDREVSSYEDDHDHVDGHNWTEDDIHVLKSKGSGPYIEQLDRPVVLGDDLEHSCLGL